MPDIDWSRVDAALDFLKSIDVVELAASIVEDSRVKGAKEAYNVAGKSRFQLAKLRNHCEYLDETICKDDLHTIEMQIEELKQKNDQKRKIVAGVNEQ